MDTIWFPGLGNLHFTVKNVAFQIFGLNVYWYGIIIAIGFLLAVVLGMRSSKKFGIEPDNIIDLVLFAAPVSIVTSRLYYVIFSLGGPDNPYIKNPIEIINVRNGGLAIYGAVIGALITAYIFARVKKIKVLNLIDFGVPYMILAQAIGRWGNFFNQEAFGSNTSLPWGMTSEKIKEYIRNHPEQNVNPDLPIHPTFLYESLWNFAVFFFLIWYRKRKKNDGEVFFLYMILYGIGRFFIEGLRTDSLMLGPLRISQFLALVFVIVFSVIFYVKRKYAARPVVEGDDFIPSKYGGVLEKLKAEDEADGDNSSSDEKNSDNKDSGQDQKSDTGATLKASGSAGGADQKFVTPNEENENK